MPAMGTKSEIIIVGAGAAGLMAARELAKAEKKVVILEARNRIGGRIWPLPEKEFGYPVQGGAEFVHGPAPITKSLIREAGLTFVPMEGEIWSAHSGKLAKAEHTMPYQDLLHEKLKALEQDMPIAAFLDKNFREEKYAMLRNLVIKMVEGYDAADPNKISTFSLREEWLGGEEWQQGRIKEGYGALLNFLLFECKQNGVDIYLNQKVQSIEMSDGGVSVDCLNATRYIAEKVVVTLSLPTISSISFDPKIPEKIAAASKIGFGNAIKLLLRFKDRWWTNRLEQDFSKLDFVQCDGHFAAWWTQYPELNPILTGWMAGPITKQFKKVSDKEIVDLGLDSLSDIFKVDKDILRKQAVASKVINWPADPLAKGAYSYSTIESEEAYAELRKPVDTRIFFAGEALCLGKESATVEGALASGKETAAKILINRDGSTGRATS